MKKLILLLTIALTVSGCNSTKNESSEELGMWQLSETLVDIGDGKGTFQYQISVKVIEFKEDGTVSSNGNLCVMTHIADQPSTGNYDSEKGTIKVNDCAKEIELRYEIKEGNLILYYQCIEACAQKFKAIK